MNQWSERRVFLDHFIARELGAATITVDGTGERSLVLAISGPPVPVDSRVMVGYFAGLTDSEIIADQANPGFLENAFIAFGSGGAIGEGTEEPPFAGRENSRKGNLRIYAR